MEVCREVYRDDRSSDQAEGKAGGIHKCLVGSTDGEALAEERAVPVDTGDGKGIGLSLNLRCKRDWTLLSQTSILLESRCLK
jgi:hypothetical protein